MLAKISKQVRIKAGIALIWLFFEINEYQCAKISRSEFGSIGERIRQIEAKALRKLRHPTRSERLRSFLETGQD